MINIDLNSARKTSVGKCFFNSDQRGYEPEITDLILKIISHTQDKTLFINVGSNIGIFPLIVAKISKINSLNIDIYAHEPFEEMRSIAYKLMEDNNLKYELREDAISNVNGKSDFFVSAKSDSSCSIISGFRECKYKLEVNTRTLDSLYFNLIKTGGYKKTIILIDVESAEHLVLSGATNILEAVRPIIICEVLFRRTETELENIFSKMNYNYFMFDGNRWKVSDKIIGDRTYKYRDWLFLPKEIDFNYE